MPLKIETVVDPDINGHGLYALLKLSKQSSIFYRATYFVTPISILSKAPRKIID